MSCHTCCDVFYPEEDGVDPPCNKCPVPRTVLTPWNQFIWSIWEQLSSTDRDCSFSIGGVTTGSIINLLELYGVSDVENYEKVRYIEAKMYPFIIERSEANSKKNKK